MRVNEGISFALSPVEIILNNCHKMNEPLAHFQTNFGFRTEFFKVIGSNSLLIT